MNPLARILRQNQTEAEARLWRHLRNRGLIGHKFRRQYPIGSYIADFVCDRQGWRKYWKRRSSFQCLERYLVIEADGGQHAEREADDSRRTRFLESQGFKVLRFWNNDVLSHTESVLTAILNELNTPIIAISPSPARGRGPG